MGENFCKSYIWRKGLVSKIYKELLYSTTVPWEIDLNRNFFKEVIQIANKHMTKYQTSLAIRETQVKTTKKCHFTPTSMTVIKKTTNNKSWQWCGKIQILVNCWWDWKMVQPLRKTWMNLKSMILTERTKTQKAIYDSNYMKHPE